MIEAFWAVIFINDSGNYGAGVLVLENGLIRGGDSNYYYVGDYKIKDEILNANVRVKHYFGEPNNIFGPLSTVNVNLSGKIDYETFYLNGEAVGLGEGVRVQLKRIGEISS
jgi:hypothetical protein